MNKINTWTFALSLGIVWCACTFLLGLTSWWWNWGTKIVDVLSSLYIGYRPDFIGSIIGGIWAFFDALIIGLFIGWIYNVLTMPEKR